MIDHGELLVGQKRVKPNENKMKNLKKTKKRRKRGGSVGATFLLRKLKQRI